MMHSSDTFFGACQLQLMHSSDKFCHFQDLLARIQSLELSLYALFHDLLRFPSHAAAYYCLLEIAESSEKC